MVQAWWIGGLAVPAVFLKSLTNNKKKQVKEEEPVESRYVFLYCLSPYANMSNEEDLHFFVKSSCGFISL